MVTLRALITGAAGFAGSHLADHLLAQSDEWEVYGIDRAGVPTVNLAHLGGRVRFLPGDLTDFAFVRGAIEETRPDYVFHLAAQPAPTLSQTHPGDTLVNNTLGQLNVLEAVAKGGIAPRVLAVGSAHEYGAVRLWEIPVKETNPLRPNSPYAVSKIVQDMLGYQYFISHGLPVVRVRPFNHIGPRQSDTFVASSIAKQIAEAELGLREPTVQVGNLASRRDFTDVRDIVRGYRLALEKGEPGEVYNIGAGRAYSIQNLLDLLLARSTVPITVQQEKSLLRAGDVEEIVCDASKFRRQTGWQPVIPIQQTVSDLLDYWRQRLRQGLGGSQ